MLDLIYRDDLTGLANRRYLKRIKEEDMLGLKAKDSVFTLVMTDIDHFKSINDTYGHLKGDEVIKGYAEYLISNLRKEDIVIRYGGDEFIVLQPGMKQEDSRVVWQRIIDRLKQQSIAGTGVSISVGLSSFPNDGNTIEVLIEKADKGLYDAKRSGRGKIGSGERERIIIPAKEFVDRHDETENMKEAIESRAIVLIRGPAGIGKTRLVREVLSPLREVEILWGDCVPFNRQLSYYPIRNIIKYKFKRNPEIASAIPLAYRVEIGKLVPEIGSLISDEDMREVGETLNRYRLYEGFTKVLGTGNMKKLIVIDNIQWIDEDSVESLRYALRSSEVRGNYIFISRTEEKNSKMEAFISELGRERPVKEINVDVFDMDNTKRLLQSIIGEGYDETFYKYIFSSSGGNPFYVEEILKSLYEAGNIPEKHERFIPPVNNVMPHGIEDVVKRKFLRLSNEAQEILKIGSVLGYIDTRLVGDMTGYNESHILGLIDESIENGILKESDDERIEFSGEIVRDIIYRKEIGKLKRKFMHKKIAGWLENKGGHITDEELAYHYREGGDLEKTLKYSLKAAKNSQEMYTYKEAIKFYDWAKEAFLALNKTGEEAARTEIDIRLKRGTVLNVIGRNKEAEDEIKKAVELAYKIKDVEKEVLGLTKLATIYEGTGRNNEALTAGMKAFKIAQTNGLKKLEIKCLNIIGSAHNNIDSFQKALRTYQRGLRLARETGYKKMEYIFHNNIGNVYVDLGQYKKAMHHYSKSLEVGDNKLLAGGALNNMGVIYYNMGEYDKAISYYKKALEIARQTGDRVLEAVIFQNMGSIYGLLSNPEKAIEYRKRSLKISSEIGDKIHQSQNMGNLGDIYMDIGKYNEAAKFYEDSLLLAREIGNRTNEAFILVSMGNLSQKTGDFKSANKHYKNALKIATNIGKTAIMNAYIGLLNLYEDTKKTKEGYEIIKSLNMLNKQIDSEIRKFTSYAAIASFYLSAGETEMAQKFLEKLHRLKHNINTPPTNLNILLLEGRLHLATGEYKSAIEKFNKALELSKMLKRKPDEAEIYLYLGKIYELMKNAKQATEFQNKGKNILKQLNSNKI